MATGWNKQGLVLLYRDDFKWLRLLLSRAGLKQLLPFLRKNNKPKNIHRPSKIPVTFFPTFQQDKLSLRQ